MSLSVFPIWSYALFGMRHDAREWCGDHDHDHDSSAATDGYATERISL